MNDDRARADGIRSAGTSMVGRHVGPFEIAARLGAGGMGEVYRARDTKLGRDVAIKILPRIFTTDPDRRARLDREARVLAALNHPHIGAIYGLEELDGTPALVLELVEGDTLAERLAKGPLPITEALTIARQIADAIDAAHEKGIVHRDLKPANIKITPNGIVKVLDFGLAKAASGDASGPDLTQSPTVTIGGTHDGVILGTAPYMSPEQARGKSVDKRTDVWAFGCVLYEMLIGRVAFAGDTLSDTIAAILEREPEWSALPAATPAPIRRLLLRCLEKDAKRRLRDIGDVRTDIDDVLSGATKLAPAPTVMAPASAPDAGVAALVRRHRGALELAALIVALAVAGAWYLATRDGETASLLQYDIVQLTTTDNATLPAISHNGQYFAYVQPDDDGDSLWIRDTATKSSALRIVPPKAGIRIRGATFTPDGTFVDFLEQTPTAVTLWRVPFLGGQPPKHLIDRVDSDVAWSADGRWLALVRADVSLNSTELILADFDGRNERVLATRKLPDPRFFTVHEPEGTGRPAWSPNGEVIATGGIGLPGGKPTGYTIFVTVANGMVQAKPQTPPGTGAWIDDSRLVWNRRNCQGAPRQLSWLSYKTGELSKLTNDVSNYAGVSLTRDRDSLVTARTDIRVDIWVGDGKAINGDDVVPGAAMPLFASGSSVAWVRDRLLYTARSGGCLALSAFDAEQRKAEEIIPNADSPAGTSDGRTTVYVSRADDKLSSLWKEGEGGRNPRQLAVEARWPVVTPDDQSVIYVSRLTPWSVSINGGEPKKIADVVARTPDVSPDGKLLAFVSSDDQIVVCKLPDCSSQESLRPPGVMVSLQTGGRIRWTPDQSGIAYVRVDRAEAQPNIWIQPLDGSPPRRLTRYTDGRLILDFAWSRDGARLAITHARVTTDIALLKGLRPPP